MTREERDLMKQNLKKIEIYCNQHFIPEMKNIGCNQISACWEIIGRSYLSDKPQYKYTFTVYQKDGIFLKVGGLVLRFGKTTIHTTDVYENVHYAKDLILNWQSVKSQLESCLSDARTEKSALLNFAV